MRKFLFFSVVLILTLISPIYAFADDLSEVTFTSDGQPATQEEIEQIDAEVRQTAQIIYNTLSDNGTRATPHDVNDVYNLLVQIFYNQSSGGNEIVVIRQMCTTINTSCNGIAVNTTSINNYIQAIYNSLNPDYDDTGISLYSLLHTFYDSVFDIDGSDGQLSIIEALVYIETELEDVNTNLASIYSSILSGVYDLDQINVNIASILSGNNAFHGQVNSAFSNVNANLALIISRLQSLQNDFNNVSWSSYVSTFYGIKLNISDSEYISTGNQISGSYYFQISPFTLNGTYIYKITLPIQGRIYDRVNFIDSISLYSNSTFYLPNYYIDYNYTRNYVEIYFIDSPFVPQSNQYAYILINFNNDWVLNSSPYSFEYISSSNLDFYTVYNWLSNRRSNEHYKIWRDLYASDDLIKAKEDQQAYEDQAIEDFTGSGSAAATGQDLGDMKSISGAIKSGLQSGGSVNNALAPFNTNSGFWGWFSQNNYDNINNIPSSGTRSGNSSQPDIIDFYTNNQYTLQGLLSGGGN